LIEKSGYTTARYEDCPPQRIIDYINPCKVVELLERKGFIGPIYFLGHFIKGLIVPFEAVFREISYHLNRLIAHSHIEPLTERQFVKLLEAQQVVIHPKLEHFEKSKTKRQTMAGLERDKLKALANQIQTSTRKLHYDTAKARWILEGRYGAISADSIHWCVSVKVNSKRHASSVKKQLAFMEVVRDGDQEIELRLDRMPTEAEGPVIRKLIGLKKLPTLTDDYKNTLKTRAHAMRRGSVSETPLQSGGF
jgi:hypothetical protein